MLRLEMAQIEAMERQAERDFAHHLSKVLRNGMPDKVADLTDDELDRAAEEQVREAKRAGLSLELDIFLYVTAAITLRPDFPHDMPGLFGIVTNEALDYDMRERAVTWAITDHMR